VQVNTQKFKETQMKNDVDQELVEQLLNEVEQLETLLNEVRGCFTRDYDLPNNLLTRIDKALG